jgi:hypothetical protein
VISVYMANSRQLPEAEEQYELNIFLLFKWPSLSGYSIADLNSGFKVRVERKESCLETLRLEDLSTTQTRIQKEETKEVSKHFGVDGQTMTAHMPAISYNILHC